MRSTFQRSVKPFLPILVYGCLIILLAAANWKLGYLRAAGFLVAAGLLYRSSIRQWTVPDPGKRATILLLLITAITAGSQLFFMLGRNHRGLNDIGWTTEVAVAAIDRGESIYATPIDQREDTPTVGHGFKYFWGYKYGPVMARFYAPFIHLLGSGKGVYAANGLLFFGTAAVISLLVFNATASFFAVATTLCVFLLPPFNYFELFSQGVNDLLPTLLALISIYAMIKKRSFWAGAALGLSLVAKPLPGALYFLLILPLARWRSFVAGLLLALATALPDFRAAPREMIANLVLFNFGRSTDSTGLAHFLPDVLKPVLTIAGLGLIATIVYDFYKSKVYSLNRLIVAIALVITLFLATGKIIHRNYFFWWTPLVSVYIGLLVRNRQAPPGEAGT